MMFNSASNYRACLLSSGLSSLLLCIVFAMPAVGQDVWVDFTSDFHDGDGGAANDVPDWIDELNEATDRAQVNDFTAAERAVMETVIISELERIYAGTKLNFVTVEPAGDHDVIYLGADNVSTGSLGVAAGDIGNRNTSTYAEVFPNGNPNSLAGRVPKIFTANFFGHIGFGGSRAASVEGLGNALAGSASHELGHGFGLFHHYVYSADGILLDDGSVSNTGGLQTQHIIATGSNGNTAAIRVLGGRTLSPFSRVIIDIAGGSTFFNSLGFFDNDTLIDNPVFSDDSELGNRDAGGTIETATTLSFETGEFSGKEISFVEADLDGASDNDFFRFDTSVESILTTHVFSEMLGRGDDEFDPTLTLYDADGNQLAYADDLDWRINGNTNSLRVDAELDSNSDSSSTQEGFLFNISLSPGTYYLEVKPTQNAIGKSAEDQDVYWLVTSLELSELLLGDMNGDGVVDNGDIGAFALALFNRSAYSFMFPGIDADVVGDFSGSGRLDNFDIAGFAAVLF